MYRKTESHTCDLCQHEITEKNFAELALPLTTHERAIVRTELERQREAWTAVAPAPLRSMLALQMLNTPDRYTMQFCRPCLAKLFGSLLENLKASCLEHLLEDIKQKRESLQEQD